MIVKLLTEHHLKCLSIKEGCRGSSESTLVKMLHCWKSHAMSQFLEYMCTLDILLFIFSLFLFQMVDLMKFLNKVIMVFLFHASTC